MKQPSRAMTWVTTLCPLSDPEPASHLVAFLLGLQATSVTSQASGCMGPSEAGANRGLGLVMVQYVFWFDMASYGDQQGSVGCLWPGALAVDEVGARHAEKAWQNAWQAI